MLCVVTKSVILVWKKHTKHYYCCHC